MSFLTSIYGLQVLLNQQVPGIAVTEAQADQTADLKIHFGAMPDWFQPDRTDAEVFYASPDVNEDNCFRLMVWAVGSNYFQVRYADGTQFLIDKPGTRIWATWPTEKLTLEDTATYLLGPVMGFVLLLRGFVSLHASAIAVGDRAVALVGPGGSGKSTTAAAFADMSYGVLAEDVVTIQEVGEQFMVRPAYPSIRLWPASVAALYGDDADLPKLTPTWDKCYLDLTQKKYDFRTSALPLAAIYLLDARSDAPTSPSLHDISSSEAIIALLGNSYVSYLMDKKMRAVQFEMLGRLLKTVHIRKVIPHSDPANIDQLCKTILSDFSSLDPTTHLPGTQEEVSHV